MASKYKVDVKTPAFTDGEDMSPVAGIVHVPMTVTQYDVDCIIDAALSGDSMSWIERIQVKQDAPGTTSIGEKVSKGGAVTLYVEPFLEEHKEEDYEGGLVPFVLTFAHVVSGLQQYVMLHHWNPDVDSTIGDTILQLGLFGEVIFS